MLAKHFVLLDIDGTLLRAGGSGRAAMQLAMIDVYGTAGDITAYKFAGKTDFFMLTELLKPAGFTERQIADTLPRYGEALIHHMRQISHNYTIAALPGARELVDLLVDHDDVLLGLLTGNMPGMADMKLRGAGFDPSVFSVAVYGSEARLRHDLAPIALARAEHSTGKRFHPSHTVIVGDTVDDIGCAHGIGARVIAVTTGNTPRAELEEHPPVIVLDDLSDTQSVMALILDHNDHLT